MKKQFFTFLGILLLLASSCRNVQTSGSISEDGRPPSIQLTHASAVRIVIPAEHANPGMEVFLQQCADIIKRGLGDVIMNAVEIAALYEKQGKFSVDEVLDRKSVV